MSAKRTTQAAVAGGTVVGSISAILSGSSSQGAWSSINQIQLYLLVPLVGTFVHKDVIDYLEGLTFSMFSLEYFELQEAPGIKSFLELFPNKLNTGFVEKLG